MLRQKITNLNTNNKARQFQQQKQTKRSKPIYYPIQQSLPNSTVNVYQPISHNSQPTSSNNSNPFRLSQVQILKKNNSQLKQKQQLYIQKLMKLQQGLQKQYVQFMTLQQLYNQLLHSYKIKEEQIEKLQQLYRQTQRIKYDSLNKIKKTGQNVNQQSNSVESLIKQNQSLKNNYKQSISLVQKFKTQNSKLKSQLIYLKSKEKMSDSMMILQSRVLQQLQEWQKQIDEQKQDKIKLQYQNQYLKTRNQDLQKARDQLQRVVLQKQKQITKLRQEKINYVRQTSQQRTSRSPSPTKSISQSRRRGRLYDQLKKQYEQIKKQLESLKQNKKYNRKNVVRELKQLNHQIVQIQVEADSLPSPKSAQFFSFNGEINKDQENNKINTNSRQQISISKQSNNQLPTFPPELQIDNLIEQHKKQ